VTGVSPHGRPGSLHPQSLRAFLALLESKGELEHVDRAVHLDFELSAYLSLTDRGAASLFRQVVREGGARDKSGLLPVVGNVLNSRERMALALGVEVHQLHDRLVSAIRSPIAPRAVQKAPCQEVESGDPDLASLPIPWFFEHETGPYITAGVIACRDPQTGHGNLSIARLKPLGGTPGYLPNEALIGIAPSHHLSKMARVAAERAESLPIAVTVGNHPAVVLASCFYLHYGEDEAGQAGALLGEALEVARCRTSELFVPAQCELVLEGRLDARRTLLEGPVSEFHGMYEEYGEGFVVAFDRLTRRRDALFQVIEPGYHSEHVLLAAVAIGAGLTVSLRHYVPAVREVAVPEGGSGRITAVVQLARDHRPGDPRRCMLAAWGVVNIVKRVVVVDEDIDPWSAEQVDWAVSSRVRPERDLLLVPDAPAERSEPLDRPPGVVTKWGIDATMAEDDRQPGWQRAAPPPEVCARVRRLLRRHTTSVE
jgi:2,5-furandicarboxylate decarboxylase 1